MGKKKKSKLIHRISFLENKWIPEFMPWMWFPQILESQSPSCPTTKPTFSAFFFQIGKIKWKLMFLGKNTSRSQLNVPTGISDSDTLWGWSPYSWTHFPFLCLRAGSQVGSRSKQQHHNIFPDRGRGQPQPLHLQPQKPASLGWHFGYINTHPWEICWDYGLAFQHLTASWLLAPMFSKLAVWSFGLYSGILIL